MKRERAEDGMLRSLQVQEAGRGTQGKEWNKTQGSELGGKSVKCNVSSPREDSFERKVALTQKL